MLVRVGCAATILLHQTPEMDPKQRPTDLTGHCRLLTGSWRNFRDSASIKINSAPYHSEARVVFKG